MPTVNTAITVITRVTAPSDIISGWGGGAVVGTSTYASKNTLKKYANLAALQTDHGADSAVSKAAASAFAQGAAELYAVSIRATGSTPTAAELTAALDTLTHVSDVQAVCLAGIGTDKTELTAALKTWADSADKIFVVTNAAAASIANITAAAPALSSPRGYYVAYRAAAGVTLADDIAGAVLGTIITSKPGQSFSWAIVNVSGLDYFTENEVVTLEEARVCALFDLTTAGSPRLSTGLSLTTSETEPAQYLDTTVTRMYITAAIRQALADYRLNTRKAPYTPAGLEYVRSILVAAMDGLVAEGLVMDTYTVTMPTWDSITPEQRSARKVSGIAITCAETGNMQEFVINLTMEAA